MRKIQKIQRYKLRKGNRIVYFKLQLLCLIKFFVHLTTVMFLIYCSLINDLTDLVRDIIDPSCLRTIEELDIVEPNSITINQDELLINIIFTPTNPEGELASLIGLCILVKLRRSVPTEYSVKIVVKPGSHVDEQEINTKLVDSKRIDDACNRADLMEIINLCITNDQNISTCSTRNGNSKPESCTKCSDPCT